MSAKVRGAGVLVAFGLLAASGCDTHSSAPGAVGDAASVAADAGILCIPEVGRYVGEEPLVFDLAWSPDGTKILTGSTNLLRSFAVAADGSLTLTDSVYSASRFNSVQWSLDGTLAFAPTGTNLAIYAVALDGSLSELSTGPAHNLDLQRVALSPDGTRLLSCDIAGITRLYDIDYAGPGLTERGQVKAHDRCTRVAWSPSGTLALSAGRGGFIALYHVDADGLRITDSFATIEESGEAIFGRDDFEAVGGSFGVNNTLWYFQIDPSAGTIEMQESYAGHHSGIGALEWSHSQELLLSGAHDHATHILGRRQDGPGLTFLSDHPDEGTGVHSARWSPDDRFIARTSSNQDLLSVHKIGPCD